MNWDSTGFGDYEVDVDMFNAFDYNSQNFPLSTFPLTGQYMFVEGELYLHHKIDISDSNNIITSGLPANVDFAVVVPNETSRISSLSVKSIDRISTPWDWVESWQGFALTEDDYGQLFNPDNADTYNLPASQLILTPGVDYELVINAEGRDQINFFLTTSEVRTLLLNDEIQIDFHIDFEFSESDYTIDEDSNTYNAKLHWIFPDASYLNWDQFEYHPDITSTATFNASFYRMSEFTSMDDFKATVIEEFQFYPNEYNLTEFTFTGFDDSIYEVTLNLTHGGDFQDRWSDVKAFGITVQTASGERYLNNKYIRNWQHSALPEHTNEPIFTFDMFKDFFDPLELLNDTEILLTYYYTKESLSYYSQYDDILAGASNTFIIRDSQQNIISNIGNLESVVRNNITFTEAMKSQLSIGENFSIEMEVKTKGGLLDTKHVFYEVQPYEMRFYNNYYPFSGGSIIAPLYYNLSANYQYQLALNYRLQEKSILEYLIDLTETHIQNDEVSHIFGDDTPIKDFDDTPVVVAYFYDSQENKVEISEQFIQSSFSNITVSNIGTELGLTDEDTIYISIIPELHNKYQPFHDLSINLINDTIILTNWTVAQQPESNLIANFETPYFNYDVKLNETISRGKVKQIYAILNKTNYLTYYLTEDLNDPINGWNEFDTLIMKLGFLNSEVLDHLNISFYYENGGRNYIGSVNVTLDMIDIYDNTVYIRLPVSSEFSQFTVQNNAHITFTPVFYNHSDFQGFFYDDGYPAYQTVEWNSEDVKNGLLRVNLDKRIINQSQQVYVFNDLMDYQYAISDVRNKTQEVLYGDSTKTYTMEFDYIKLPEVYIDALGNTMKMRDGDILFIKFNASLEEGIGISVEDIVVQKKPCFTNYETKIDNVPIAEISLLGINNDGNSYIIDDLYEKRDKLVAWNIPLDLTPFASEVENTYKQQVFNISLDDIYSDFKVLDSSNFETSYITDILITSNDPRYELVIDSIFLFEFDENATLYDSDIFDVYPNNHLEKIYVGNYTDIYSETIVLDASSFLPIYQSDPNINETYYFDVFDGYGNWFYFGDHLDGEETSAGIYDITWNSQYNEEYYYAYTHQDQKLPCDVDELYEYYNPHVDKFNYLYISWADTNTWNEWQTIEQININSSTLDIVFEYYDDATEEYTSVHYNQTLNEFTTQQIAVETVYPYASNKIEDTFNLSQDYKAYFFNETSIDFDPSSILLLSGKKSMNITAPNGFKLDEFEQIIVYFNFTEGAYSDYTQFKLLQAAIDNNPGAPIWTKNDSFYVDYEYNDIDYFLLIEDYSVGSEDSLFEYLSYIRNDNFVTFDYKYEMGFLTPSFEAFTQVDDPRSVLELFDNDLDTNHELVIKKDDISGNGIYDSYSYGEINPAGEISFHTLVQEVEATHITKDQTIDIGVSERYQLQWDDLWRHYYVFADKTITTYTTTITSEYSYGKLIQKDINGDGNADSEVLFRATFSTIEVNTVANETTHLHFKPTIFESDKREHHGYLSEVRNSTATYYQDMVSFMFRDFANNDVSSTRYYEDMFPNELSEVSSIDNYLVDATNDQNDEDPNNDVTLKAPVLEGLLALSHARDGVPALFDQALIAENEETSTVNILAVNKQISVPNMYDQVTGLDNEQEINANVIEVIPKEGVDYDINNRFGPDKIDGKLLYFDDNNDGAFSTIFVTDMNDNVLGIGLDTNGDFYFESNKRQHVERHIIRSSEDGWFEEDAEYYTKLDLVNFQDKEKYEGYFLEPTFSDAYYDIWKMQYDEDSSKLIEEAMSITSNQFIQSVSSKFWSDVEWQMAAQAISAAVGAAFAGVATILSQGLAAPIIKGIYAFGHFITYAILNAVHSYAEERDQDYWLRSQTFHNPHYEGEEILSEILTKDKFYGDMMTGALWGSSDGIYAPVKVETNKHAYEGEVILAPRGEQKTDFVPFIQDLSYKHLILDYSQQTRNYFTYSDFNDPRVSSFYYELTWVDVTDQHDPVPEIVPRGTFHHYMPNSIMYLEDSIHNATLENEDKHYDSIVPYMVYGDGTFVPMLRFADSNIEPVPEFYEEYPIFVAPDQYSQLENEHHVIYKAFDGSSDEIQLVPEYLGRTLKSDVVSFNAYTCQANIDGTISESHIGLYYDFTFNETTGKVTLSSEDTTEWKDLIQETSTEYIILEFHIEKYRSVDDLRDLTSEQVNQIATMQSAHASILEYTYQHTIATKTQKKLSQMAYTVLVTLASTLPLAIVGGIATGIAKSFGKGILTFAKMIVFEALEEVYLDPWIEATVAGYADEQGWSILGKAFAVSFAESGRETFGSSISTGLRSALSLTQSEMQTQAQSIQQGIENSNQIKSDLDSSQQKKSSLLKLAVSSIVLFSTLLGGTAATIPAYLGASLGIRVISAVQRIKAKRYLKVSIGLAGMMSYLHGYDLERLSDSDLVLQSQQTTDVMEEGANQIGNIDGVMVEFHKTGNLLTRALLPYGRIGSGSIQFSDKNDYSEEKPDETIDVWFRRNGDRLIDEIIDKNLDLSTKMGKEIKKALHTLMTNLEAEKKYRIYDPSKEVEDKFIPFDNPNFQNSLDLYMKEPERFGGIIYAIEVFGEFYAGLSVQGLDDITNIPKRFINHMLDTLRGYTLALEGISYPSYHKAHKAIAKALEVMQFDIKDTLGFIDNLRDTRQFKERKLFIASTIENIKPFIQFHIIQIHPGSSNLGKQENLYTKQFPFQSLIDQGILDGNLVQFSERVTTPDYLDLKLEGLNMVYGGAVGKSLGLPMYDIAIMVALGFSSKKISGILTSDYGLKRVGKRSVQHVIDDILGGAFQAQADLLKPIIETLDRIEGISKQDIYLVFKNAELMNAWFTSWSLGNENLEADLETIRKIYKLDPKSGSKSIKQLLDEKERIYAGLPENIWLSIIEKGPIFQKTGKGITDDVAEVVKIGDRKTKKIIDILCKKHGFRSLKEFKIFLHRQRVENILLNKFFIDSGEKIRLKREKWADQIIPAVFLPFDRQIPPSRYIEKYLFPGMTLEQVWNNFYLRNGLLTD
jgi:hypothetical protein